MKSCLSEMLNSRKKEIRNLCDKALWINEGKVVAFDEVNKVCDAYLKAAENASKDQLKNSKLE